jgi:molybdopterin-binding protein
MKTNARNQLPSIVTQVNSGAVNTEVDLELADGEQIAATVTN